LIEERKRGAEHRPFARHRLGLLAVVEEALNVDAPPGKSFCWRVAASI
jgi:hypothetical protein